MGLIDQVVQFCLQIAQIIQFAVAHVRVDRLERFQTIQILLQGLRHLGTGLVDNPGFQLFGNRLSLANQTMDHRLRRGDQLAAEVAVDRSQLAVEGIERHFLTQILAVLVHQQTDRCRRHETVELGMGRRLGNEDQLQQDGADGQRLVLEQGNRGSTDLGAQDQVDAAAHHGVIPGEQRHVIPRQGGVAIEGDGHAILRQPREAGDQHVIPGGQHQRVLATVILIDADLVEHLEGEGDHAGVVIFGGQLVDQLLGGGATAGVDLQQAIAALFQTGLERLVQFAGLDQQGVEGGLIAGVGGQQLEQFIAHCFEYRASGRAGLLECVQTIVIPELQGALGGALQIGNVDLDGILLTDTIQSADTLFQQIRVERQIEQHQMAGKLEVATL